MHKRCCTIKNLVLCLAVVMPVALASMVLAEIWCYDANDQFLGIRQSDLIFFLPQAEKAFQLSESSGLVSFSPYYFKEEGCKGQPYTMLPMNRLALGPDGKLHSGSSPLVRFKPASYRNEQNECLKLEDREWTDAFSKPVDLSDPEFPISFPVAFPLTYKYVQVGSPRYGEVHSGMPARPLPGR